MAMPKPVRFFQIFSLLSISLYEACGAYCSVGGRMVRCTVVLFSWELKEFYLMPRIK